MCPSLKILLEDIKKQTGQFKLDPTILTVISKKPLKAYQPLLGCVNLNDAKA